MSVVLVVDNESANLRALCRYLADERPHWEIVQAESEAEAASIIAERPLGVVITDLVMVDEDSGVRVLESVKRDQPLVPVILMTAYEAKLDRYAAFGLGAFDCVPKNAPGVVAAREILVKATAALRFRADQEELGYLRRYFDRRVYERIRRDPLLLSLGPRIVTTVFWDIRGFSKIGEDLKGHPQLVADFLREYFDLAADAVFQHGGVLDKFIGDGVMALFGALEDNEDDGRECARQACSAALHLRREAEPVIEKWMERWSLYTPARLECGIGAGAHTGEVLVGNVGTDRRDQFTALGPHVNFAARLEGRAEASEVLISSSTAVRVRETFLLEPVTVLRDVKNIAGDYEVFRVLGRAI